MHKLRFYFIEIILSFVVIAGVMSCSDLSREQRRVRKAAEKCYEYLKNEKYDKFVDEIAYADSMSEDYREQMVDLLRDYAASETQRHGKLSDVKVTGDTIIGNQAHVYLQVVYADSTSEEIGLPMVKVGKKWKMQ